MNLLCVYTGIPYRFHGYNCWDHVRRVRSDFGLDTPRFDCASPDEEQAVFASREEDSKGMKQISEPSDLCAVLIGTERNKRIIWHSGVYMNGMVSHCDRYSKQVRLDTLRSIKEMAERVEFWR